VRHLLITNALWEEIIDFVSLLVGAAKNTMAVLIQRTYHSYDDPDKELEPEHLAKGYRYGRTLVRYLMICHKKNRQYSD